MDVRWIDDCPMLVYGGRFFILSGGREFKVGDIVGYSYKVYGGGRRVDIFRVYAETCLDGKVPLEFIPTVYPSEFKITSWGYTYTEDSSTTCVYLAFYGPIVNVYPVVIKSPISVCTGVIPCKDCPVRCKCERSQENEICKG